MFESIYMEGYTTAGLLNQEDNFKIISKTLLVIVSIIKKNNATIADMTKTIKVVVIVSFLVGHTILDTSLRTCCTYFNGLAIVELQNFCLFNQVFLSIITTPQLGRG